MDVEADLIDRARGGGEPLERLITALWPEAYRVARTILRDAGHAEDAAQEACARIAASLTELRESGAFRSWSYRIVVNEALAATRKRRPAVGLDAAAEAAAVDVDPSEALDLWDALGALSPLRRAAIVLRYHCGFSSREIAAAMGVAAPTVRFHLTAARRELRRALAPRLDSRVRCGKVGSDAG